MPLCTQVYRRATQNNIFGALLPLSTLPSMSVPVIGTNNVYARNVFIEIESCIRSCFLLCLAVTLLLQLIQLLQCLVAPCDDGRALMEAIAECHQPKRQLRFVGLVFL